LRRWRRGLGWDDRLRRTRGDGPREREVSFLFPWAVAFGKLGLFGFWSMMVFLAVLTIGFIYEWRKGALEWD
jgi:hypothetical protein